MECVTHTGTLINTCPHKLCGHLTLTDLTQNGPDYTLTPFRGVVSL
jgi:hypothetical protein